MSTIDICEYFSSAGCIKQYYVSKGISDYSIIPIWMCLSIGDIKNDHLSFFKKFTHDEKYNYMSVLNELQNNITSDTKIRIWSSYKNDDDYMFLLFMCDFLKDKTNNISVIFSSEYKGIPSITALDYKEIEHLLKYEHSLSKEEINSYSSEWKKQVEINSELRVLEDGVVKNKNYADYHEGILNIFKDNAPCTIANLISECMVKELINDSSDLLYLLLIDELLELNKIKIIKKGERHFMDTIALS